MSTSPYLTETLGNAAHASACGAVHFRVYGLEARRWTDRCFGKSPTRANAWWAREEY